MEGVEIIRAGVRDTATLFRLAADDLDKVADELDNLTLVQTLARIKLSMDQTAQAVEHVYSWGERA